MSVTKHTPGPWQLVPDPKRGIGIQARANSASAAHIAYVQFVGTDLEDGLANANLIAAAPELLAALKEMLEQSGDPNARTGEFDTTAGRACRVIAKAEGR